MAHNTQMLPLIMKSLFSALLYGALNHALYSHAGTIGHEAVLGACVSNLESEVLHKMANQTTGACYEDENGERIISEASYIHEVSSPAVATKDVSPDLGVKQIIDSAKSTEIYKLLEQAQKYMAEEVMVDKKYDKVRDICENKNENCAFWAVLGECENNPAFMKINCAPVCKSCEQLHVETRCPLDPDAVDALYPGDVNKLFERIVTDPYYQQYEPKVLSRPNLVPGDTEETADYLVGGPWMMMFDNAISDEEADHMIELGGIEGYERSADVGTEQKDGTYTTNVNSGRTSTNAWCSHECYEDPVAKRLMDRIANITGIPEENSEYLQLLRYERNQFYQTHSDYIPFQIDRPTGVRILTFYFYLSDVEEGGGTNFPVVNLTVQPKRGRAVLWPSVLDKDPNNKDSRADHQAMPVIKGVKYGANAWVHQRDYKTPHRIGC